MMILIIGDRCISMNVGDSRALLSKSRNVISLTRDHKPVDWRVNY